MQGIMAELKEELQDAHRARAEADRAREEADRRARNAVDLLAHAETVKQSAGSDSAPVKRRRGQESSPSRPPPRGPTSSLSRGRRRRRLQEQESSSSDPTKKLRRSPGPADDMGEPGTLVGMALPVEPGAPEEVAHSEDEEDLAADWRS